MKLAVLFSGGKDSSYVLFKTIKQVVCLISIISKNKESYMYHTPNIHLTKKQAEVINLPLIQIKTEGRKEKELIELKNAIKKSKEIYKIDGIVTGAIESVYQVTRIQKICAQLNLWCFNPIWKKNQIEHLNDILKNNFSVIISGVFAPNLNEFLGKELNREIVERLIEMEKKYKINPCGEGGEFETTVLDAPIFKKKIIIKDFEIKKDYNSGVFIIKNIDIVDK